MILVSIVGGIVGCTTDSVFGATIQGMWRCRVCGKKTEKKTHCMESAEYLRGSKFFDNNIVNLVSGFLGALASLLLYLALFSVGFA